MPAIVLIAIIGLTGGVLSGLFGIGGGLVIVPALILIAGFPIATAAGTSLAALLLPVGLFGAIEYYRAGNVNVQAAAVIAVGPPRRRLFRRAARDRRFRRRSCNEPSGSSCWSSAPDSPLQLTARLSA